MLHAGPANAFTQPLASTHLTKYETQARNSPLHLDRLTKLSSQSDDNDDQMTTVGSSEYYQGFINRSVNEEPTERVTGDALLGPIMKFAGGAAVIIAALTAAFLASNGII